MHLHTLVFLASLFLNARVAKCLGPSGTMVIGNQKVNPDGFERVAIGVNGQFPSPLITANKGDRFELNVVDSLTDSSIPLATSIHWHGLFQRTTNYADGAAFVTQCPISPNHSFLYDFASPTQAGTYWYHSHLALQYCDGLRGPLVIYDPKDPYKHLYDVDDESTVITIADWMHFTTLNLPFPPIFSTTLINGLGRFAGGPLSPLSVISVKKGLRYRFRILNMACDPDFVFGIAGHTMTVIEADGVNHEPLVVDSIHIYVGQRYSFILTANQPVSNYWIRAIPNYGTIDIVNGTNSAILRYVGAPATEPAGPVVNLTSKNPLNEVNLHPLVPSPVPGVHEVGAADVSINLAISTVGKTYTINGASFVPPNIPVLLQILSGAQSAQDLIPKGSYYALPANKVIEISIPGATDAGIPHPFHLHGHTFHVIRSAGSTAYNWVDPAIRDVVNTGTAAAGDNVTFRFITDNDGPWFLHCHIDFHLNTGLAVVLAEDTGAIHKEATPLAWDKLCPIFDAWNATQA